MGGHVLLPACLFWGDSRQGPARKVIKVSTALILYQGGEVCLFFQISKTLGSSLVLVPLLQRVDTAPPPTPKRACRTWMVEWRTWPCDCGQNFGASWGLPAWLLILCLCSPTRQLNVSYSCMSPAVLSGFSALLRTQALICNCLMHWLWLRCSFIFTVTCTV